MNPQLDRRINGQREFFISGRTLEIDFRIRQLTVLRDLIYKHEAKIFEALRADLRKSRFEAYTTEIGMVLTEISQHLKNLHRWSHPERVSTNQLIHFWSSGRIIREPYGLVLIISPWNFPFLLIMHPLIGAISAGNCIALKPTEFAPRTIEVVREILHPQFPEEYISVYEGNADLSKELLEYRWDYIFFTGSQRVAKEVMSAAARHLTPLTLELGGKSPCIVEDDADLAVAAARIAWGKFVNAGQTCIAPDHVFVHATVREEFVSLLRKQIVRFFGKDPRQSPDYGRIISKEKTLRLEQLLMGATVLHGGEVIPGELYMAPTLVALPSPDHPLMQEEIFGPILPILEYVSLDVTVRCINEGSKPLALWTPLKTNC